MKTYLLLLLPLYLTGCASIGGKYTSLDVSNTKVEKITIPDSLLTPCKADKPIDKSIYLNLKPWEREQYMTEYSVNLLRVIKECNLKIAKIKELNKINKE